MSLDRASLPAVGGVVGGRYRVLRLLGEGGMGAVYEAENTVTGRRVALKLLNTKRTSGEAKKRLLREARVAARVQHPNVIDIFDVGFEGDELFLVMEMLRGQPLDEWLADRTPVEPEAFLGFVQQLLRGLGALHAAGVIHRDLKPANVFIVESEHEAPRAKVLDLGIARDDGSDTQTFTRPNQILGTPAYMSPEQLERPEQVDHRADLHAVGVIMYEAFAGRRPYEGRDLVNLVVAIVSADREPLASLRPDLPEPLCAAVERAMEPRPGQRFGDAKAMADALAPFSPEDTAPFPTASPPPPRRPLLLWVGGAALAAGLGAAAWATVGAAPSEPAEGPVTVAGPPDDGPPPASPDQGPPLPVGEDPEPVEAAPVAPGGSDHRDPSDVAPSDDEPEPTRRRRRPAPHLSLDPDDF